MTRILIAFFLLTSAIAYADRLTVYVTGGANFARLSNNSSIPLLPNVTNEYFTKKRTTINPVFGIGGGYIFNNIDYRPVDLMFSLAAYQVRFGAVKGLEFPFINSGVYNTFNYKYRIKSRVLMFETLLFYKVKKTQPFLLIGLGRSKNEFYNYNQLANIQSGTPAPASFLFRNNTEKKSYAYEVGFGLQREFFSDSSSIWLASLEGRYFGLRTGRLGTALNQATNGRLAANLYSVAALISLRVTICNSIL